MMKLYWIKAQAPRRVLALAKHLGLDIEFIKLDPTTGALRTPDYAAMNPNRKAPTLVDGDRVLWEASAINAYLCIRAGSDMWPANAPDEQVEVLQWLSWCDHHWSPVVAHFYFEHVVKATFNIGPSDPAACEPKRKELARWAGVLDAHLEGRDFVALNRLTIADFQLASMACHWREADMQLEPYPNLTGWLDRLDTIPAWADPWPDSPQS